MTRARAPLVVGLALLLAGPTAGDEGAPDVVARAVRALEEGDGAWFEEAARGRSPDAWEVADLLEAAGRTDAALRLASAVATPDREALTAYLGARDARAALTPEARAKVGAALAAEDLAALLAALSPLRGADAVLRIAAVVEASEWEYPPRDLLEDAVESAQAIGWARGEKRAALALSGHHVERGAWEEGRRAAVAVVGLRSPGPPDPLDAAVFARLATCHAMLGDAAEARGWFRRAAEQYAAAGADDDAAWMRSAGGVLLLERGDLVEAHREQVAALEALRGGARPDYEAHVRMRLAAVLEMSGLLAEAEQTLSALAIVEGDVSETGTLARANLARTQFLLGEHEDARATLRRAVKALEAQGAPPELLARTLWLEAWVAAEAGGAEDLVERLGRALAREWPDARLPVLLAEGLGRVRLATGAVPEAVEAFRLAREKTALLQPGDTLAADVPGEYGAALARAGAHDVAKREVDAFVQAMVGKVAGIEPGSARTFRGIVASEALSAGVSSALETDDLDALWRYLEAGRGIRLLAALGGRTSLEEARVSPDLLEAWGKARREEVAAHGAVRDAVRTEGRDAPAVVAAVQGRDEAVEAHALAARRVREARADAEAGELGSAAALLPLHRARSRLPPGSALVTYSLAMPGDEVLALVVGNTGQRVVRLPGRAEALALARVRGRGPGGRGLLREETPAAVPEGGPLDRLRAILVAPLGLPPYVDTVHVVPDGALAYVPFAAIFGERRVALAPSGTVLALLDAQTRRTGRTGLALGNPDPSGPALKAELSAMAALVPEESRSAWLELDALPGSEAEARGAAGEGGTALVGPEASIARLREALTELRGRRLRTLHFACHGLIHADSPLLSGLALTDGLLTAQDVLPMRLDTDLVVLAACDTATDPYASGEGMTGLVRAFLHAGAPRVLATLWSVPDEPTRVLMERFYEALADPGTTVAEALRLAQETVRERWPDPWHWAGWTLWGLP